MNLRKTLRRYPHMASVDWSKTDMRRKGKRAIPRVMLCAMLYRERQVWFHVAGENRIREGGVVDMAADQALLEQMSAVDAARLKFEAEQLQPAPDLEQMPA